MGGLIFYLVVGFGVVGKHFTLCWVGGFVCILLTLLWVRGGVGKLFMLWWGSRGELGKVFIFLLYFVVGLWW